MSDHHVVCGKCGIGVNFVCDNCKQEEPCPWCHGLRSNFRSGDMGYGEEDFDSASSCPSSTQRHPCEERVRRVNAEAERDTALARAEKAEAFIRPRAAVPCVWQKMGGSETCKEVSPSRLCESCQARAALAPAGEPGGGKCPKCGLFLIEHSADGTCPLKSADAALSRPAGGGEEVKRG